MHSNIQLFIKFTIELFENLQNVVNQLKALFINFDFLYLQS